MNRLFFSSVTIALSLAFGASGASAANDTGFHTMHALKRVGGKLCMASHTHAGISLPSGSKSVAIRTAINKWEAFTREEYGSAWGKFSAAWAKAKSCKGGDGNWVCEVTARPCRH